MRSHIYIISKNSYNINGDAKVNSRKCEVFNIDVHRASFVKHLRGKTYLNNEKQLKMIIADWLFQEPIDKKN